MGRFTEKMPKNWRVWGPGGHPGREVLRSTSATLGQDQSRNKTDKLKERKKPSLPQEKNPNFPKNPVPHARPIRELRAPRHRIRAPRTPSRHSLWARIRAHGTAGAAGCGAPGLRGCGAAGLRGSGAAGRAPRPLPSHSAVSRRRAPLPAPGRDGRSAASVPPRGWDAQSHTHEREVRVSNLRVAVPPSSSPPLPRPSPPARLLGMPGAEPPARGLPAV